MTLPELPGHDALREALIADVLKKGVNIGLTLAIAWIALRAVRSIAARAESRLAAHRRPAAAARGALEHAQRINTVLRVGYDVVKVIVVGLAVMTVLADVGVSVQPLVAGAGLAGAAVAFGSQTVVKDFVAGFFILLENHFDIGDSVVLGAGIEGVVEKMTLRVTIVRASDGSIFIVPNGTIATVTNKTHEWSEAGVKVAVAVGADPTAVRASLSAAAAAVEARDAGQPRLLLGPVRLVGPVLKDRSLEWALTVRSLPANRDEAYGWLVDAVADKARAGELPSA